MRLIDGFSFVDFEVYLKTKIDKAAQIDRGQQTSEKGYPALLHHHHHHPYHTNGGVSHNQLGQQPLHPGFVLPPKYMPRDEYCSVKSIDDSRASVYFTPLTNGTGGHAGGLMGVEDENMSQKSIQATPIHINYIPEGLEIPEEIRIMCQEIEKSSLSSGEQRSGVRARKGRRSDYRAAANGGEEGGMWSDQPERLSGGGGGADVDDTAAAEEMMMRMSFGRLGNLDEDTSEILLHELIQKKLKRDRRNRLRFYDERRRQQQMQQRLKAAGGNCVAEQGLIEATAGGSSGGGGHHGGGGMLRVRGRHSRRPVLASAMDPEFLRLMNGGGEGIPLHRRVIREDYENSCLASPAPARMVVDEVVMGPSKRRSGGVVDKAEIMYHSIGVSAAEAAAPLPSLISGDVMMRMNKKKNSMANAWPPMREDSEEEDDDEDGDRFTQRQMFTSKSLPEISRKRGKRRNKGQRVAMDEGEESGALLGTSTTTAKSSIQMATIEPRRESPVPATLNHQQQQQQTANTNSNANGDSSRLLNNGGLMKTVEQEDLNGIMCGEAV